MLLVTGANGYVGRNLLCLLRDRGIPYVAIDDFSNSSEDAFSLKYSIKHVSIFETPKILKLLRSHPIQCIIHLAAKAYVEESIHHPQLYFESNYEGTRSVLAAMRGADVRKIIFASSCTVYRPASHPVVESSPLGPSNPYGQSKLEAESAIRTKFPGFNVDSVIFRFFNVVGGLQDGRHADNHNPETHLLPRLVNAAIRGQIFRIYGNTYPTFDGTPVRDFIHVLDVCEALILAYEKLQVSGFSSSVYNLGTGTGHSVLSVSNAVKHNFPSLQIEVALPREGDVAFAVADSTKAKRELGWSVQRNINEAIDEQIKFTLAKDS